MLSSARSRRARRDVDGARRRTGLALAAGSYDVTASHDGFSPKTASALPAPAKQPAGWPPIVLSGGVAVSGVVHDDQGAPIVGATVTLIGEGAEPTPTATDGTGAFRVSNLRQGPSPDADGRRPGLCVLVAERDAARRRRHDRARQDGHDPRPRRGRLDRDADRRVLGRRDPGGARPARLRRRWRGGGRGRIRRRGAGAGAIRRRRIVRAQRRAGILGRARGGRWIPRGGRVEHRPRCRRNERGRRDLAEEGRRPDRPRGRQPRQPGLGRHRRVLQRRRRRKRRRTRRRRPRRRRHGPDGHAPTGTDTSSSTAFPTGTSS